MEKKARTKKARTYRLSEEILRELREIAQTLGISETEAVSRAIHSFYVSMKGEEQGAVSGAIVPFSEYQKTAEQLKKAIWRAAEMEAMAKARENVIVAKDEHIQDLRAQIESLQAQIESLKTPKWWEFWRK